LNKKPVFPAGFFCVKLSFQRAKEDHVGAASSRRLKDM